MACKMKDNILRNLEIITCNRIFTKKNLVVLIWHSVQ